MEEYVRKHLKQDKIKNKSPEEIKEMFLKNQLVDILEKKGIFPKNIKNKTYAELKSEYDKYINNAYIESYNDSNCQINKKIEISKDIVNKLWLEILE